MNLNSNQTLFFKKNIGGFKFRVFLRSDPYIFSLATNPFYLWLICTIFSEAGEDFIPKTLTQLYTWVMLVFANRYVRY